MVTAMDNLADGYSIAWAAWAAAFVVIEGAALYRKGKGDTLSEHVWQVFSIKHEGKAVWIRRGGLASFLIWLAAHLLGAV